MIMKKSFPLLRAIGLSAGLVASAAMMAPAQAATSGSITATGTVPVACSVSGATITMAIPIGNIALQGKATNVAYSTGSATRFSLSTPTLVAPSGFSGDARIYIVKNGDEVVSESTNPDFPSNIYIANVAESGVFDYHAFVGSPVALIPGTYTLTSTLTCVGQ